MQHVPSVRHVEPVPHSTQISFGRPHPGLIGWHEVTPEHVAGAQHRPSVWQTPVAPHEAEQVNLFPHESVYVPLQYPAGHPVAGVQQSPSVPQLCAPHEFVQVKVVPLHGSFHDPLQ